MKTAGSFQKQQWLVKESTGLLHQALGFLDQLDDETYRDNSDTVGAHLRHILEFYECFLEGIKIRHVDYDARRRDRAVETGRLAAQAKIQSILRQFHEVRDLGSEDMLWVRAEDSAEDFADDWMMSSTSRELQFLRSHTIHHYALIVPGLRSLGVELPSDFGVAPSTLRYRASRSESAVPAEVR